MKINKIFFIIISLFLPFVAHGENKVISSSTFEPLYAQMRSAMASRDTSAVLALLAPNFISEDASGNQSSSQEMVSGIAQLPKDPNKSSTTVLLSVIAKGDIAEVKQQYTMNTQKSISGSEPQPVKLVSTSNDTWENINGKWLLQKTVTLEMEYSISGKLIKHVVHK